ncbi:hypothetical protein RIR_jg32232.t1 [Rhizophagus irregularis DAOM 181602=DAOM 197198]|nr:hypothetical protein RIR_jg32232.t1 [Rhizophagus irregularis DAOM 181602=DAOM 197198]CAG8560537.1 2328_t:CDS:2 [Rhizophagus irregularis]
MDKECVLDKQNHNIPIDRLLKQHPTGEMELLVDPKEDFMTCLHFGNTYVYTPMDQHRSKYSGLLKEISENQS